MNKIAALALLSCSFLLGEMKVDKAGAPPQEAAPLAAALSPAGLKILKDNGSVLMEIWFVKELPKGGTAEPNATFPNVAQGALLGVARFPDKHSDRRDQTIKPGVYTLRYSRYPTNGDHMGVAPQRDFVILSPAATDTDPAATPNFAKLMSMSRVASGTPHPLVLSIWKEDLPGVEPGIEVLGDEEQILHTKIGGVLISLIVAGAHIG